MVFRRLLLILILTVPALPGVAEELILPVFALNSGNPDGSRTSTEVYLVNTTTEPVQVSIGELLPGQIRRSTTCGQFMSQTHVVPPESAVLWTASGIASDLDCADEVLGALTLRADGELQVTGRMVRHPDLGQGTPMGVLSGGGQAVAALPTNRLPGPTALLLPTLLWHRNPCGDIAFSTSVGFANPGIETVTVTIDIPTERRRAIRIDGRPVPLPHQFVVEPESWTQLGIAPLDRPDEVCLEPESFDLEMLIDGPLAVYGSVLDHKSKDARTVEPVDLEPN
jgi:hypothetical protein